MMELHNSAMSHQIPIVNQSVQALTLRGRPRLQCI